MQTTSESNAIRVNGVLMLAVFVAILILAAMLFIQGSGTGNLLTTGLGIAAGAVAGLGFTGLCLIQPNDARVITFLGRYVGTVRESGFWWVLPLTLKSSVSLRINNFISEKLKVNDADGNPIEIAAVIVWQVADPGRAIFDVQNYRGFVQIQAETALRKIATRFPYDSHGPVDAVSLRAHPQEVCQALRTELQGHLAAAGIVVLDAQISHLAYAPEIAQAMLRRQQAQAVIAARMQIVDGAVGMVEAALRQLGEKQVVNLSEERKAQMVSNLLVTLVSESSIQPMVNTGSL